MITKVIDFIKEIRLFISFIMSLGLTSALNWDLVTNYVDTYNIHIVAGNAIFFYAHNIYSNRRHKKTEIQVRTLILENTKTQIRAEIRQAYKDYKGIEIIDFETTIKYLTALNKKKIDLGVNSYTDEMMNELLGKIKL